MGSDMMRSLDSCVCNILWDTSLTYDFQVAASSMIVERLEKARFDVAMTGPFACLQLSVSKHPEHGRGHDRIVINIERTGLQAFWPGGYDKSHISCGWHDPQAVDKLLKFLDRVL